MTCVLYQNRGKKQVLAPHSIIIALGISICIVGQLIWKVDLGILPNYLPIYLSIFITWVISCILICIALYCRYNTEKYDKIHFQ